MGYFIGLDMGTSSVGWAVTDERYHLLRRKGKDLWGVRLFDEANTAAERRSFRTSRRRLDREKARIAYLKEIFAPAINEKDPGFFQRLEDSKFHLDDKQEHQRFAIFADTGYTDKEYHEDYPTAFHLRKELVENADPHDVRLVYLAVLNMFKHRGHFLNPNLRDGEIGNLSELMDALKVSVYEQFEMEFPSPDKTENLEDVLIDRTLTITKKAEEAVRVLKIEKKNKAFVEICRLFCGRKGTLSVIFTNDQFSEDTKKFSVSFRDGNYEEAEASVEEMLSPESFEIFLLIKQIHDWGVMKSVMQGYEYVSEAKVASYEQHQQDLKILKKVYRTYLPEQYDGMFRVMSDNNYSAYVGSVNSKEAKTQQSGTQKVRRGAKKDEFFKTVKNQIQKIEGWEQIEDCQYIIHEIECGTFLPKQRTTDNGVIPNQVHRKELRRILENAEGYLPFLLERDPESNLTASERILQLFSFRIPYYVGPLKGTEGSNSWAVRKEDGPVYPWNLEQRIDVRQTSEKFIENLIRRCTYLSSEKVMPKASLRYERFMVLNELNNLKIHEEKIPVELKQEIYRDLFRRTGKRVTNKKLVNFLRERGYLEADENEEVLSGYDKAQGGFANTLANYHKFMEVFGVPFLTDEQEAIAEDIIFYSTVYGDSKGFLKDKIEELHGKDLSAAQIKRVMGYRFKDWGNLSKEFLDLEGADASTGEIKTLIVRMWDENKNLMQLMDQQRYTYSAALQDQVAKFEKPLKEIRHEDLDDLYISAPVRRMVWQTIRIVQEIVKVMGEEPERIFVEMTRSREKDAKRTVSRKALLQALYKGCSEDEKYLANEIDSREEREFRIKKLYLYYRQKGRCMYSGESISLDKLFDDSWYDIDHIYPRHYVKDDSLENNLVLVKAELNREKTDVYPIASEIRHRCAPMWKSLRDGGFLSEEKYRRLVRTQPFSQDELVGFINRQLVETAQGTKAIAGILTQIFSGGKANDRVVYVKAGNVSEFRNKYALLKCRAVNDFHHANDAYLNIVVGNTYFTKFTRDARNFFKARTERRTDYNLGKIFDFTVQRGDMVAWNPKTDIETVRRVMSRNTPLVTKRCFVVHGGISDQQIVNAKTVEKARGVGYIPIKASDERMLDTMRYGGFSKASGAYFFLVEHTKKRARVRTIESMPVYLAEKYKEKDGLELYCREILHLVEPDVRWNMIRMYSLLNVNGFPVYLTGRSNDRLLICNAVQLCLKPEYIGYIREIEKAVEEDLTDEEILRRQENGSAESIKRQISREKNLELYEELLKKHVDGIYSKRANPIGFKLVVGKDQFMALSMSRQCYVLDQILQISRIVNQGANLKDIGGSTRSGVSMVSKTISDLHECKLKCQSITGLYEQEIDLLTV